MVRIWVRHRIVGVGAETFSPARCFEPVDEPYLWALIIQLFPEK